MKKEIKIGKRKVVIKLLKTTTKEKIIGIVTWAVIIAVFSYLIFKK